MERLLITGVDRAPGCNLALALADRYEVLGLYEERAVSTVSLCTAACDWNQPAAIRQLVDEWRPRTIIHCGPLSAGSWDPPADARAADRDPCVVALLAQLASDAGARLTVLTSDVVFAGPRMFHEEDWPAAGAGPLAASVLQTERALERAGALVLRTHAYGWSPARRSTGFAERLFDDLAAGRTVALGGLRHATPILDTDLAELVARADERRLQGLYHAAGAERTSPWGFATALAAAMGLPRPSVSEDSRAAFDDNPCLDETSLNSRRLRRALAMPTPMLADGLERFVAQAQAGWRDRWQTGGRWRDTHELAA